MIIVIFPLWSRLPGYRHSVGVARSWHFIDVYGFIITGLIFIPLLFVSGQWTRLFPDSRQFRCRLGRPSSTTQIAISRLNPTGLTAPQRASTDRRIFLSSSCSLRSRSSPARRCRRRWGITFLVSSRIWRQARRAFHPLSDDARRMGFLIVHVALVALTGFERNMNHIVLGTDNYRPIGMILGFFGVAAVITSWIAAHDISWKPHACCSAYKRPSRSLSAWSPQSASSASAIHEKANLALLLVQWQAA